MSVECYKFVSLSEIRYRVNDLTYNKLLNPFIIINLRLRNDSMTIVTELLFELNQLTFLDDFLVQLSKSKRTKRTTVCLM